MLEALQMEERAPLSRPARLGTRRRRPRQADAAPEAGASRSGRQPGAPSLDTDKHLQTTVREWANAQLTERDLYRRQIGLHGELLTTYHKLWQDHAAAGNHAAAVQWEKRWLRLHNCRNEWLGFQADCCKSQTRPVAVPIGCNDRLCPLCAYDRSRAARKRIKELFGRLTHPVLITLTVPNLETIRKHDYTLFRQRVRKLIAQHPEMRGGVYSLETTYNRERKTWHIHAHMLCDFPAPLPAKTITDGAGKTHKNMVMLAGEPVYAFTAYKMRLEFDWLRLWSNRRGKMAAKNASAMRRNGDTYIFEEWVREGRANRLKIWSRATRSYITDPELSAEQIRERTEWNRENRRVVDARPVTDRDGAAREVLKYITKVADFGDDSEAVEIFATATKGVRLIQTWGTWYGFKAEPEPGEMREPETWGEMQCACGLNDWRRMGVFYRRDVEMDPAGRWHLIHAHDRHSPGTVPRATIRALEQPDTDEARAEKQVLQENARQWRVSRAHALTHNQHKGEPHK